MKKISEEQIKQVLGVVYNTNISARQFDELSQFFRGLEDLEEVNDED